MSISGSTCRPCCGSTTIVPPCPIRISGDCVYYSGSRLSGPGINVGDNFNVVTNKLTQFIGSGGFQNLQSVTTFGNTTTNDIIIGSRTNSVGRFSVEKTFTSLNVHGFDDYSTLNASSGGFGYSSYDCSTTMTGTVDNDHYMSYQSRLHYTASGNLIGLDGMTGLKIFNQHTGTGTITNAHGVYIFRVATGGGPVTNAYGLRISSITTGVSNFAIRSEGGKNSFADEVLIGSQTTAIAKLDVRNSTFDQSLYVENTKPSRYAGIFNSSNGAGVNIGLDVTASGGTGNKGINFGTAMGASDWNIYSAGASRAYIAGKVGIGVGITSPTSLIHLAAGTATANTGPLKFTAGTNLTTPENGTMEFDGTNLYITIGGVRRTIQVV
jgi:hypothetical protein